MFARNNTAAFMDEMFTEDTHKYIRELARVQDTSEKERKKEIVKHAEKNIAIKVAAKQKRQENAIKAADLIAQTTLEFDKKKIEKMIGDKLRLQVKAFIKAGAPKLDHIKSKTKVPELKEALLSLIDSFNKGEWHLPVGSKEPQNLPEDDEEEFEGYDDIEDEGSAWEDEENLDI